MQYITGGTMQPQSGTYVMRDADYSLCAQLARGEFCYVLTSRQMGKSSLMVQTAVTLQEQGVLPVIIDLSEQGYNLDETQWYNGLINKLGERLDIEDDLEEFRRAHADLSPLQRWQKALRDVVLKRIPGRIVIFLDEIDITRRLRFSTDEFFAAIRACYNGRTRDAAYDRLTFCLLGVASPTDLIRDPRLTPFNIGARIELRDFTDDEAFILRYGLGHDDKTNRILFERICHWTAGHPYLTQRLCKAVADDGAILTPDGVDRCCHELFFTPDRGHNEANLIYVRQRLAVQDEAPRAALLTLYQRVLSGKRVPDNETAACVSDLKLSGVVRPESGSLLVRNPIYRTVFDARWVREQMPDAELRRQHSAFLRGVLRTGAIAAVILAVVGGLALFALVQTRRAQQERQRADRLLYAADMNLAQQAINENNVGYAQQLVDAQRPEPGREDLRGFEWRYLWGLSHQDRLTLRRHTNLVYALAFAPNGQLLASGSFDHTITLWDTASGREITTLRGHTKWVRAVAFAPDGRLLASGGQDGAIKLWDVATLRQSAEFPRSSPIYSLAFSPDGKSLASGSEDGNIRLWDVVSRHGIGMMPGHRNPVYSIAFSPDGKTLVSGNADQTIRLWDVATKRPIGGLPQSFRVYSVAFSPDGKLLASGGSDGGMALCDLATKQGVALPHSHTSHVYSLAFSPDGKTLASGCWDNAVGLWDVRTRTKIAILKGHSDRVNCVAFSSDGKTLASGSNDDTLKLWDIERNRIEAWGEAALYGHMGYVYALAFSPDGKLLASCSENTAARLWDVATKRQSTLLPAATKSVGALVFSPDGKLLAVGCSDHQVRLWDVTRRRLSAGLVGHSGAVTAISVSPDSKTVASGSGDTAVRLWNVAAGQQRDVLPAPRVSVTSLAFSPDGKMLAVGGDDNNVGLWDMATRRLLKRLSGHSNTVFTVAFSPEGRLLASGSWDRTVKLWDVATGHEVGTLRGHTDEVKCLVFAPDGRTLASGSFDGTVKLWNMVTQQPMITFRLGAPVYSVTFSPDGTALAAGGGKGGQSGFIRIWSAPTPDDVAAYDARER
jgi:WD40 repeat protein